MPAAGSGGGFGTPPGASFPGGGRPDVPGGTGGFGAMMGAMDGKLTDEQRLPGMNGGAGRQRQQWIEQHCAEFGLFLRPGGGGTPGTITSVPAGRCVDVNGAGTANGTAVQLWDCNSGGNQQWNRTAGKQLTVYGTKCMDAQGGGTSAGTPAVIWDCSGGAGQQWNVNSNATITGVQSGLCLDAYGGGTTNGTKLVLWTCHGGTNQQWQVHCPERSPPALARTLLGPLRYPVSKVTHDCFHRSFQ